MVYEGKISIVKKWLNEDPSFEKFQHLVELNRLAPNTAYGYGKSVGALVKFLEVSSPSEALQKFKDSSQNDRVKLIDGFVRHALDNNVHSTTVLQMVRSAIKKWLELNEVPVNWVKIQNEVLPGEEALVSDRMPSNKELKQIMNEGGLRDRTMILILISSGLRVGTLTSLTVGEVNIEEDPAAIIVQRKPGRKISRRLKRFVTFITPEAKDMLKQYLDHRTKNGEKLTASSPLITSDRKEEIGKFLSPTYLSNHWRRLLRRAHLATKSGSPWHDIHIHTLRKFFRTQCTMAGVKSTFYEVWMGHTGSNLAESYFRGETEAHKQEYMKAIPYLSVLEEVTEVTTKQVEKQDQEIVKLRKEVEDGADLILKLHTSFQEERKARKATEARLEVMETALSKDLDSMKRQQIATKELRERIGSDKVDKPVVVESHLGHFKLRALSDEEIQRRINNLETDLSSLRKLLKKEGK